MNPQKADPIQVVYPGNYHKTYEAGTFVMGQILKVTPESRLSIQGQLAPLSVEGFFSHPVSLEVGNNAIRLALTHNGETHLKNLTLHRQAPLSILPKTPLAIHPTSVTPQKAIAVCPGGSFYLSFCATPGVEAWLEIEGVLAAPVQIPAIFPNAKTIQDGIIDNREPLFQELQQLKQPIPKAGWHSGIVQIPLDATPIANAPIRLHLKSLLLDVMIQLPIKFAVWDNPRRATIHSHARPGENAGDGSVIRQNPPEGERTTPLYAGAELWIDAILDDWARIRLSPQDTAWVAIKDMIWQADKTHAEPPYVLLGQVNYQASEPFHVLSLSSALPLPLDIAAKPESLGITLYGATMTVMDSSIPLENNDTVSHVTLKQTRENVVELEATLSSTQRLSGFDYRYSNQRTDILLKPLPKQKSEIRIVLDPGHGGGELGSTGLSGLPEKDLNLRVAKQLQSSLLEAGFGEVLLTRNNDVDLSLPARGEFVRQYQPHIVLSLHHNALPDGRDPRKYEGSCCFYYHAFSKPLAEALQQSLVENARTKNFGVFHESFYMTRIPQAMSVLIELGFFTNPKEYERLIDPTFQKKAVDSLTLGLIEFVEPLQ
ncbi:MAG: N-acetylmuramoyl-L-alanine amidase [Vampirovibrionales bacterium]|nr:N-acetylmuramoyl-L-alanine amidase [Vampirovibrionales bacterium]